MNTGNRCVLVDDNIPVTSLLTMLTNQWHTMVNDNIKSENIKILLFLKSISVHLDCVNHSIFVEQCSYSSTWSPPPPPPPSLHSLGHELNVFYHAACFFFCFFAFIFSPSLWSGERPCASSSMAPLSHPPAPAALTHDSSSSPRFPSACHVSLCILADEPLAPSCIMYEWLYVGSRTSAIV